MIYRLLFGMAGFGILAWLLLIFAPAWRFTRRLAESAVFPAYLALIYVVGVAAVFRDMGPGIMADFGTADGVLKLLRTEAVGLVAWIHILAFDQVVAHLIYRDNMKYRFVPLPIQSVLLFVTLMLGPLGFLSYWIIRTVRARQLVAWGEADRGNEEQTVATKFYDVVTQRSLPRAIVSLWQRERVLVVLALIGFSFAAVSTVVALVHGDWVIGEAGRVKEAVRFDVALGIYLLTLAILVPLAGFTAAQHRYWTRWQIGITLYAFGIENIQAWRGVDPRFSRAMVDSILGGIFFVSALGILALFVAVVARFFRREALPDHPAMRNALRYGATASLVAFAIGVLMSATQGRFLANGGNLMALHAAGFHGLQAVPLVALFLGWSTRASSLSIAMTHVAGMAWLVFCAGLLLQALMGAPPLASTPWLTMSIAGTAVWLIAFGIALASYMAGKREPALTTA